MASPPPPPPEDRALQDDGNAANATVSGRKLTRCYRQRELASNLVLVKNRIEKVTKLIKELKASGGDQDKIDHLEAEQQLLQWRTYHINSEIQKVEEVRLRQQRFRAKRKLKQLGQGEKHPEDVEIMSSTSADPQQQTAEAVGSDGKNLSPASWCKWQETYPILKACPWVEDSSLTSEELQLREQQEFKSELSTVVAGSLSKIWSQCPTTLVDAEQNCGIVLEHYEVDSYLSDELTTQVSEFIELRKRFLEISLVHGRNYARGFILNCLSKLQEESDSASATTPK